MAWAPSYATTAQARTYVTRHVDTVDDVELDLAVAASSRAVDRHCNRQFGLIDDPAPRTYSPRWDRRRTRWLIAVDDVMTAAGMVVEVAGETLTSADYTLEPVNAAADGKPWTQIVLAQRFGSFGEYDAAVTARWGWTEVPEPVVQATLLQTNRLFARRTSPFGIAGSPEQGSEMRLLARLDPDVAVVLGPFMRWWGAA